jgi:ABC-type microcin C transport system duplicated ATPase subunit YejF
LTNVVAPAETEATDSIQMQSCLNCVLLIDIKRQKEVLQRILVDVIGFRGVGITGVYGRQFVGRERQGIAIGRAMHRNADLIVLDEPKTTSRRG